MSNPIVVDEEDPLDEDDELPFTSADVQLRTESWVSDDFDVHGFLGRGKFGEVKKCVERATGVEFAAKFISAPRPPDKKDVHHEISIMKKLKHRRLIQLYQAFEAKNEMCLILEIIYGGELFDRVISEDFILTEKACQCFIRQICEGIEYMHGCCIIHLDMKPENILCISQTGNRIKIIDFGLAREWNPKKDLRVLFGTPEFMAPEVVQYEPITFATDMWSVGVICYVLLSGLSPFMGDTDADTLQNVIDGDYDFDYPEFEEISSDAKDLVSKLLVKQSIKRLSARQCLEHPWLQRKPPPSSPTLDLSKKRLKTFVYRRKWQKIVNTLIALKRMGVHLKALHRATLDSLEPGTSILSPELVTALTEDETKKKAIAEKEKADALQQQSDDLDKTSSSGNLKNFFQLGRKKSSKGQSSKSKKDNDLAQSQSASESAANEASEETPTKTKTKTKDSGGRFFNMLKKKEPKESKESKETPAKTKTDKPTLAVKPQVNSNAKSQSSPSVTSPKPDALPKSFKTRGLQRDNSLRRSTKLSKQGVKKEQYVKLKGPKKEAQVEENIAASTPNLATTSNGLQENSIIRVPSSGFGTFSRVKDRIKFLEQKESTSSMDTLTRRKSRVQDDRQRAS